MAWGSSRPWGSLAWGGSSTGAGAGPDPDAPKTARQAIYRLLATDATLDALVGGRVYPTWRPQDGPLPAVTMVQAGMREPRKLAGSAAYRSARLRISAWGVDPEQAEEVAEAIRARLLDFRGPVGRVFLGQVAALGEVDMSEDGEDGGQGMIHQLILEYRVWHRKRG